jgi:2-methylcitrate dehydratase PrpD
VIISIGFLKRSIQHPFIIKRSQQARNGRRLPQTDKKIYSQEQWYMPAVIALRRLKQEN